MFVLRSTTTQQKNPENGFSLTAQINKQRNRIKFEVYTISNFVVTTKKKNHSHTNNEQINNIDPFN